MDANDVRSAVGVVGDFNAQNPTHRFTNEALTHVGTEFVWVPTESLVGDAANELGRFDGLWISPGSPYRSMEGALAAIRAARERAVPLVGT